MNQIRIKNTAGKKHIAKYEITDFEGKVRKFYKGKYLQ